MSIILPDNKSYHIIIIIFLAGLLIISIMGFIHSLERMDYIHPEDVSGEGWYANITTIWPDNTSEIEDLEPIPECPIKCYIKGGR